MARAASDAGLPGGLDIVEEAFNRLRHAPLTVWALYYVGSAPFVLLFLYFWADMANSAYAYERLGPYTIALTAGFVWMKTWQAIAFSAFLAHVQDAQPLRLTWRRWWRTARQQAILQSTALFNLPLSVLVMAPLPYAYAFYQSASALASDNDGVRQLARRAWSASHPQPKQNLLIVWLLSPLLVIVAVAIVLLILPIMQMFSVEWSDGLLAMYAGILFLLVLPCCPLAMVIAVNVAVALVAGPELLRRFFGVETVFTIGWTSMLTPTFLVIVCGLTYLILDPFCKAAYALRYFYVTSTTTGEDLRVSLRRIGRAAIMLLIALSLLLPASPAAAQEPETVDPAALDASLDETFRDPAYAWRLPRERPESDALLGETGEGLFLWLQDAFEWIGDQIARFARWLAELLAPSGGGTVGDVSPSTLRVAALILIAVLGVLLLGMLWRSWRQRGRAVTQYPEALTPTPDLEDESTGAEALPEEGWVTMGRELAQQGDYRLAMRAYFFAGLARLASRNLIRLAGYKANREYARELQRVAHEEPQTLDGFRRGVGMFEAVWYGRHEPTPEVFDTFRQTQREVGVREG